MFSLGDGTKFWLYTKPTDMRKNFNILSGIVNSHMGQNLYSGDVFVFVNSAKAAALSLPFKYGDSATQSVILLREDIKNKRPSSMLSCDSPERLICNDVQIYE